MIIERFIGRKLSVSFKKINVVLKYDLQKITSSFIINYSIFEILPLVTLSPHIRYLNLY